MQRRRARQAGGVEGWQKCAPPQQRARAQNERQGAGRQAAAGTEKEVAGSAGMAGRLTVLAYLYGSE